MPTSNATLGLGGFGRRSAGPEEDGGIQKALMGSRAHAGIGARWQGFWMILGVAGSGGSWGGSLQAGLERLARRGRPWKDWRGLRRHMVTTDYDCLDLMRAA